MSVVKVGGSFAPPLSPDQLEDYWQLAQTASPPVAEAMANLCAMMEAFHDQPASRQAGTPHPSGRGVSVPLEPDTVKALDPHVPWLHECQMYAQLFEGIDPVNQRDLRNAAFHLLWYAVELTSDREPMTTNRL